MERQLETKWQNLIVDVMTSEPIHLKEGFAPEQIFITKGSYTKPHYQAFIEKIVRTFRKAQVIERLDQNHMQVTSLQNTEKIPPPEAERRSQGKKTLILGTIKNAVDRSKERGIKCPNYWHFSCVGYCWFDCVYCYLQGTHSILVSPAVKIFLNLEDILLQLETSIQRQPEPTIFYFGKLQDSLNLDYLTNYSKILVPFFAQQKKGRLLFLTKSDCVDNLLSLDHKGHTILSWSLNCPQVCQEMELGAPSLKGRLRAIKRCAEAGYPIRYLLMPLIPIEGWKQAYTEMVEQALSTYIPQRMTLGSICIYQSALNISKMRFGTENAFLETFKERDGNCGDGRIRYPKKLRIEMYQSLIDKIRSICDVPISLCLEEPEVWNALGLDLKNVQCNCIFTSADLSDE